MNAAIPVIFRSIASQIEKATIDSSSNEVRYGAEQAICAVVDQLRNAANEYERTINNKS